MNEIIKIGQIWKHYKGSIYEIMGFAYHSETGEPMVLYRRADMTDPRWWARPQAMWFDIVMVDSNENIKDRRFTLIEETKIKKTLKCVSCLSKSKCSMSGYLYECSSYVNEKGEEVK